MPRLYFKVRGKKGSRYEPFIDENVIQYILNDLKKRVTHDIIAKLLVLNVDLSAYIDPINLFLKGISSIGKTHCTVETSKYFPKTDVQLYADLSPKVLYHMPGKLLDTLLFFFIQPG